MAQIIGEDLDGCRQIEGEQRFQVVVTQQAGLDLAQTRLVEEKDQFLGQPGGGLGSLAQPVRLGEAARQQQRPQVVGRQTTGVQLQPRRTVQQQAVRSAQLRQQQTGGAAGRQQLVLESGADPRRGQHHEA